MAKGWSNLVEWWRRLLVWFHSIFMNKRVEKKEHPPPLKPKRIHSKESRERFLRRRAEKRAKDRLVPSEQRLLKECTNRVEEMAEVGESQGGKPEEEVNPSPLFPCSSDSLPHKEFIEKSEDETSDQNISEERSTAQKEPLKPLSRENIPAWIDDSYPDDSYFQNANGEIFILCDDSDESSEDSDKSSEDSDSYYQNAFWEEYHTEDDLSSSEEDEKPDEVLQPIQPAIKATSAEKDQPPAAVLPSHTPASILPYDSRFIKDPKDVPFEEQCFEDEADKLYDEWATEKTMQLLSGQLGGPNLLQNLFGRTREGALIEGDKPSLMRTRGGALEDDPNICKVCKRSFQRLLKHLASSADCAQEYDLQKMYEEKKAESAAKKVENKRNKRKAERAEDEPAFKAKAAAQKKKSDNALRTKDEEGFRAKMAAKMQHTRDSLRAQNEKEFKAKRAAEGKKTPGCLESKGRRRVQSQDGCKGKKTAGCLESKGRRRV